MTIQVSPEDAWLLDAVHWLPDSHGYAVARTKVDGRRVAVYLHRLIAQAPAGMCVDHIDGNPSNNQRENLRICSHAENMRNRKISKSNKCGLKGVYSRGKRWKACIKKDGKTVALGTFDSALLAHAAYVAAASVLHGEFARAG